MTWVSGPPERERPIFWQAIVSGATAGEGDTGMVDLNGDHKRHLLSTFRYLDEVLDQAEHIMTSSRSTTAFPRYAPDIKPVQRKVLVDHFARLREALLTALSDLGLVAGTAEISTLHALRAQIMAADIALEDTSAESMRGYGPLSAEVGAAVTRVVVELRGQFERMRAFLDEAPDQSLQARLERLAATTDEARLLRELARVITAHGLLELRPALAMLVERMETRRFEVAVFGRVSSGKSSLLNRILRRAVLPVGVTPITAIPTRVSFGSQERVLVNFAEQGPEVMPLSRLAEVATEQQNPGNRKHVTHIKVEVPEPRLESGVTFVDTPGLGSLATAGAEETLAYLPRCDLGIVLVDAASSLDPQDLVVVRALYQAGATAAILLSKADLLTPGERDQVTQYVRNVIASECGVDVTVSPVSVVGSAAALADVWFEKELLPLCQRQEEVAAVALRRKVGALRDAATAALRHRLERDQSESPRLLGALVADAAQALAESATLFDPERARCEALASTLEDAVGQVIEGAARATAVRWRVREERLQAAQDALAGALAQHAAAVGVELAAHLTGLREKLSQALVRAATAAGWGGEQTELPRVGGLPVLDGSALDGRIALKDIPVAVFGSGLRRRWIVAQFKTHCSPLLREVLAFHRRRLVTWTHHMVAELQRVFEAEAEPLRARLVPRSARTAGRPAEDLAAIARDLELLSNWSRGIDTAGASLRAEAERGPDLVKRSGGA